MQIIGLPLSRIRICQDWKFRLFKDPKSTDGSKVMIQVRVDESNIYRSFKTEWFLASFLVAALKQATNRIGIATKEVAIIVPRDFDPDRFAAIRTAAQLTKRLDIVEIRHKPFD